MSKPQNSKRKKKSKRQYFTQVHEDAIVQYTNSEDIKERTELYINFIGPAFNEMVDNTLTRISKFIRKTPLLHSKTLSALSGSEVYLKLENYQVTGSFKA